MADYRIQLKDKEGNRQFPVTTTQSIVDSEGRSLEEILANLGDGGGSGNGGGFEVRNVYPTKQTVLEEETIDITEEERAYNIETLSKTLSGETVFCKVGEAILFPTISMSGAVTEATYSTVVVLGGSLASYNLTITSDGDAEVAIAEVTTGGGGGSIDPEMSDTSTKAVQNKVIKKYIDDAIANVGEGCITFYKGNWTIEERLTVEQKAHNASMFQLYKTSPYAIGVFVDRSEELSLANGLSGRALKVSIPAQAQYLPIETGTEAIMLKEDLFNDDEIAMVILNDGSVYGANELE